MFKVYMTQGQGEVLVGEFDTAIEAQSAVMEGVARGDGSYRLAEGTAQEDKKDEETVPF